MRAAAILGLGTSARHLRPFQGNPGDHWQIGMPADTGEVDAILVFGGDGTVHRHLPALVRLGLPVLVVPAGSGNDFARALGLRNLRDSVAVWRQFSRGEGRVRTVDLGCITPLGSANAPAQYFACVGGVGLDADIARRANGLPRWLRRAGGYVISLPPALLAFSAFPMKLWEVGAGGASSSESLSPLSEHTLGTDGAVLDDPPGAPRSRMVLRSDRPTTLAALANAPFYGDGMKIAPEALLDDGVFDVVVIEGIDQFKLFCLFPTVYSGGHLGIKEVHSLQLKHAVIETEYPLDVYADGEYVCKTPAEFRIAPAALRVIVAG